MIWLTNIFDFELWYIRYSDWGILLVFYLWYREPHLIDNIHIQIIYIYITSVINTVEEEEHDSNLYVLYLNMSLKGFRNMTF